MGRWRSNWGADGTDGTDSHKRFTIEPDDKIQKKLSCESCSKIFIQSDLSENHVCRGCRGLGTREEEVKKREQVIKKERTSHQKRRSRTKKAYRSYRKLKEFDSLLNKRM